MLYFSHMNLTRTYWPDWKKYLQNSGVLDETALLLEVVAPLGFLLSQVIYLTGWIFPKGSRANLIHRISTLLEDGSEIRQFSLYLLKGENDIA
jgi:hypothetical protein